MCATEFSRKDLGIGYLSGERLRPVIVRSHLADFDDASKVTARHLARKAVGRITGMAAGLRAPAGLYVDPALGPKPRRDLRLSA